jgi:hypothetical protein
VSESPGEDYGAIGVLTLEDVIEELIGEYVSLFLPGYSSITDFSPRNLLWRYGSFITQTDS